MYWYLETLVNLTELGDQRIEGSVDCLQWGVLTGAGLRQSKYALIMGMVTY